VLKYGEILARSLNASGTMLVPVLLLALTACAHTAAPSERPVVVWTDASHTQPYFVEDAAIDLLPANARDEVEQALAAAKKQKEEFDVSARANGLSAAPCAPGIIGDSLAATNPAGVVRSVPFAATGSVVAVVSGWNVPRHRVASLAFVRVDDVWKGSVAAGEVITVELPFGTLRHRGVTWCAEMSGSDRIAAGRSILLFGQLDPKRLPLSFAGTGWPIENDQVLPPHAAPLSLTTLRNSIN
jgi:uncharacterized membrane protein